MLLNWLHLETAGLWSLVWHWGIGVGAIILLVSGAIFTTSIPIIGIYLQELRKDLLWGAFGVALVLGGEWIGARDAAARCVSKETVIEKIVTKTVNKAKTKTNDPWDASQ